MAKTAVVNPRRKKRRSSTKRYGRRRRNPSTSNPAPRRRRNKRRRRNPTVQSVYSRGSYRKGNPRRARRRNPSGSEGYFDIDKLTEIVPAATLGVQAARFAFHMAGPFDPGEPNASGGPAGPQPGIKHAIAAVVAAQFGGSMIGNMLGDDNKGRMAAIAALGFAGDQFLHKKFMVGSRFASENLYLGDAVDSDWEPDEDLRTLSGFENRSALGGFENESALGSPEFVQDDAGNVYQLNGMGEYELAPDVSRRPQGIAPGGSSFGYSRC